MRCIGRTARLQRCKRERNVLVCRQHRYQPWFALLFVVTTSGAILGLSRDILEPWQGQTDPPAAQQPAAKLKVPDRAEVALVVGRRIDPVFWLHNQSSEPAREPKYQFVLYDLTRDDADEPRLNLQIPVRRIEDYILPKQALGPWRFRDVCKRCQQVVDGDVLFGFATVQCLNCTRPRYYWVNLVVGRTGWIKEIPFEARGSIQPSLARVVFARENAVAVAETVVPAGQREAVP